MPKLKIVHKGLILVAVPLIFGIGFISVLFFGLQDASRLVDREIMLKDALISQFSIMTCGLCGLSGQQMYNGTHDPSWKDYYKSEQKRAVVLNKHLRAILKNERELKVPPLKDTYNAIIKHPAHKAETPLFLKLQSMSNDESKAATKAVDSLRLLLWGGVAAGILISSALAVFFCLNITNRLLIIMNNALSLSHGTALNQPFQGNDEIAELDQSLYKSATEIRELERFKNEMVGVVSHELKSPLSSVGSFLSSLSAGVYGELNAKARDKVNRTHSSVKRLMGLIGELLYLDRLELEMIPEEIQVEELLAASVDTVKELSEKSGIDIKVTSNGGKLFADRNRLVQVIVNLLSNAMKFSPQNGLIILEAQSRDGWFECRVIDQGPGIPESFRKQIFEPFKQVDATDATSKKGTGLGLTISRSIVEQHGGQIAVDSEEGNGSTFWFRVPDDTRGKQAGATSTSRLQVSNTIKPSELPANKNRRDKGNSPQAGKYGVLKQGLIIIALPLLFQIGFALLFNNMINGICKQTEQEHNSTRVLQLLNNGTSSFISLLPKAEIDVYLHPSLSKASENLKRTVLGYLKDVDPLVSSNPEQVKDLNYAKQQMEALSAIFEQEALTHESKIAFDKLDYSFREKIYAASGLHLKPANAEEKAEAEVGMTAIQMMENIKTMCNDSLHRKLLPFYKLQTLLDGAMDRERDVSQNAARERSKMISTMELTLLSGILATVVISILIAFFLMRDITSRLQHVMQNTHCLAKREKLDPPIAGNDEIAYLDHVLFETGNRLVELETFKRELVAIVSHELRTPLTSISTALEFFGSGMIGDLSKKGMQRLTYAQEEARRLIRLINDLLDIEKMEAGKFMLDLTEVKVSEPIESSISAIASLAEQKHIVLQSNLSNPEARLWVDRDRLTQVLINLLSNSIKYSPENGTITISVEASENKDQLKFSVTDQGRGIPEELRTKIFDRFVQVEKSDATERGGTGLGLAICRAIVEQHGGQIGVDSALGDGSTFWFMIPTILKSENH